MDSRRILILVTLLVGLVCFVACDKQRDLYDTASPVLQIEGNWIPSLGAADMSGRATAMLYPDVVTKNRIGITKEFLYRPSIITTKVSRGEYDVLLFNGLMFSEENTNLDHVFFRNTDNVETFEAVAVEVASNNRLVRTDGEYIASNDMEQLTSAYAHVFVEGERQYFLKYKNGHNGYPSLEDYVESELKMIPIAVSYYSQVVVHLVNPRSAAIANGALRGFVGSVMMASGEPETNFAVTHQLRLNNLTISDQGTQGDPANPERGTIESPWFVTFGPPLDRPEHSYTFELSIILRDGREILRTFDVTEQVCASIKNIIEYRETHWDSYATSLLAPAVSIVPTIPIVICLELPWIEPRYNDDNPMVNVNGWEDDEIIRVKI